MKKLFLFLVVFCSSLLLSGQDLSRVDNIVSQYPNNFEKPSLLANKINNDFKTDIEKVRAIYRWIALNIEYDIEFYRDLTEHPRFAFTYSSNEERRDKEIIYHNKMAENALKSNMAICDGYSSLFLKLCELSGIESEVITGASFTTPNEIGRYPGHSNHSWNAVRISNKWHLVDVTWAAGSADDYQFYPDFTDVYFLQDPHQFAQKHFPDDQYWILADITKKEIKNIPLFHNAYYEKDIELISPKKGVVHYSDINTVEFKIKSKNDYFFYGLSYSQFLEEAKVKSQGNIHSFSINIENKAGFITIYYFRDPIITFKILY